MAASQQAGAQPVAHPKDESGARRCFSWVAGSVLVIWGAHNALLLPWEVRHIDVGVREPASSLLASVLEELLMRGLLLGQLVRFTTSLRAQVSVAILFGIMHLPGWIALEGVSIDLAVSTLMIMVLGAVLGGVARASNSILPAIALHCANNFLGAWLGGR